MSNISPYRRRDRRVFGLSFLELGVRFSGWRIDSQKKRLFSLMPFFLQQLSRAAGVMIGKCTVHLGVHDHLLKVKLWLFRESRTGVDRDSEASSPPVGLRLTLTGSREFTVNASLHIWGGSVLFNFSSSSQITTLVSNQKLLNRSFKRLLLFTPPSKHFSNQLQPNKPPTVNMQFKLVALFAAMASVAAAGE
jgi:hypothetical protein